MVVVISHSRLPYDSVAGLRERLASQRAKDALSKWLLSFDVKKVGVLPDDTKEIFERIFGERHFSLKCLWRSAAFSLGAMAFISIVCLLINPHPSEVFGTSIDYPQFSWIFTAAWLPWSIVIDYISLFKTRLILRLLLGIHRRTSIATTAFLAMDYIVYKVFIFGVGTVLVSIITVIVLSLRDGSITENSDLSFEDLDLWGLLFLPPDPSSSGLNFVFFWSGFAPSIWMWLYVAALFVTRGLLRSEKLVNWLRWALDVEKNPFRQIGAVAATLAFIGSVVIISVSAEISNISSPLEGPTDQQPQHQEAPQ